MKTFNFRDKIKGIKQHRPTDVTVLDGDEPRSIWSQDDVLLAVYLPKLVKDKGTVRVVSH